MKTKTSALVVAIVLLVMTFLPQFNTLGIGAAFQQPETAWVVWETGAPIQRVAWDGGAIWAGAYKGGLSQWQLESGQVAEYTTENGLSGNHVTSIAVDGSGKKWLALLDGSLNNTVNGSSFVNLTPAGVAGKNAWDVAASGDDVWLATLGGGVSRYSGGAWTTYNTSNSALPHNDVYAVAVDSSGTPWVGTVNYGVAALQNGDWISYSLPVQIANPASQGALVSNQAVTDIAVDSSGNKWFATDGSGVARLDSSSTNWTVYDTSNSGLASNFIQSVHLDAQGDLWFGALSGGVSRLSADGASWLTYNSGNTPLPEDDILDIATDSQGGLWLAAYDSGLAYYGQLPASPPTFELDLFQKADYQPGKVKGYFLWVDPDTYEWTLAWSGDGKNHIFTGEILADASLTYLGDAGLEAGDSVSVNGNSLTVNASEASGEDSVAFKLTLDVTELTIRLMIDGAYYPYNIHLGGLGKMPGTAPFKIAAVQPVPPTVMVPTDLTVNEGDFVLLTGDFTDPDSLTGHTIVWDLGDGTLVEDELTVDHIYPDEGSFTAQLTVTDVHGLVSAGTTNITVENVAPDVDFYYYPFVVYPSEEITFTGYFYDPGALDTHTISWDFGDGSAPVTTTELTTTHTYAQTGTYTATLTVTDNDGGVGVATFDVDVVALANNSPQFELGEDVTVDEGSNLTRSVAFTDSDSTEWQLTIDYGDGTAPTQTTLSAEGNLDLAHVYAEDGTYTLSVTLNDNEGGETSDSILVTVANVSPVVNAGADQSVDVNDTVTVNASYTDAGTLDTHTATIDWGDGNSGPVNVTPTGAGTGTASEQHAYASTGNFTVEVCVTDSDNGTGCDSINVNVGGGFPSTGILDNFSRANGAIGSNWSGDVAGYSISSNQLLPDSYVFWGNESFDAGQEVCVTFVEVDADGWEQDLLLKSQSNITWGDGVLEALYDANNDVVQVWTWEWPGDWVQHGADIPVTFNDGDTFGARALADGTVEVYKNGELLASRDVSSWSYYDQGGYIGLWFIGVDEAILDDFGGGNIPGGEGLMGMMTGAEGESGLSVQSESVELSPALETTSDSFNVEVNGVDIFWQGISLDATQEYTVTFAQLNKTATSQKPRSNGVWGEGTIQVLYDVPNGRIQVLKYDMEKGWIQQGDDVPVKFADGNVFSVRTGKNDSIEIYRNGKLLTRQKLSSLPQQDVSAAAPPSTAYNTSFQQVSYRPTDLDVSGLDPVLRSPDVPFDFAQDRLPGSNVEGLPPLLPLPNLPLRQTTSLTIDYTYDPAGNVLELGQNLGPGTVTTTYTYNTANELVTTQVADPSTGSGQAWNGLEHTSRDELQRTGAAIKYGCGECDRALRDGHFDFAQCKF